MIINDDFLFTFFVSFLYCVDVLHDMTVNKHSWLVLDTN